MAARRKTKRSPRRQKSFSLTNAVFSVGYASILTNGIFKTNAPQFLLGDVVSGISSGSGISLKELIGRPELLNAAASNAVAALPMMVVQSVGLSVSERIFKKLMAMPLRRINSGLVKPLLGAGIKI
jgi:hypothetical protein|tara:strand:+ start:142 stop:519 length:378 start_codon:yes stop_codon:yes gene_type:complete